MQGTTIDGLRVPAHGALWKLFLFVYCMVCLFRPGCFPRPHWQTPTGGFWALLALAGPKQEQITYFGFASEGLVHHLRGHQQAAEPDPEHEQATKENTTKLRGKGADNKHLAPLLLCTFLHTKCMRTMATPTLNMSTTVAITWWNSTL